ncbi:hypothetical protein IMCC3317_10450 [Kordia antarctica]|uniref:Uncharacterized protein n=1 Tax=Kordia antarctica TaxID=1218801 RepID=A0A7L4ZG39_9FLAO|nr:hypothetical protein [Kordia antarctica]QHI35698.1 hypothetical protein IMCC3317_10450 [Kordia antarctica]
MLKNISNLEGVKTLNKNAQKTVNGGRKQIICGGTGGAPINWSQERCHGYGIQWHNGQCYACY